MPLLIKESKKLLKELEAKKAPVEWPVGLEPYGVASVAEEGLYSRSGWPGRHARARHTFRPIALSC